MIRRPLFLALAATLVAAPAMLSAQRMSDSYEFLKAVREADGTKVTQFLDRPGSTIVNTRAPDTGETAMHIVVKRSDPTYIRFLASRGGNVNAQDRDGATPLLLAVTNSCGDCIDALVARKANTNIGNGAGETPLIRAVQMRNLDIARKLLDAGANPDQADRLAGMSARDYAARDGRSPAITKLLADAPKATARAVSGPRL